MHQFEQGGPRLRISPYARKTASQLGVALGDIAGTGPGGRIVWRDVDRAKQNAASNIAMASLSATADIEELLAALSDSAPLSLPAVISMAVTRLPTPLPMRFLPDGIESALAPLQHGESALLSIGFPANGRVRLSLNYAPSLLGEAAAQALLLRLRASMENPLSLLL